MIEQGATHVGVATDHVIESFRNDLWPGYKTGEASSRRCLRNSIRSRTRCVAMGVAVWPMVELEADDALASAARIAAEDRAVEKVCIWTPDKDLAQCVRATAWCRSTARQAIRDAAAVRAKFGVDPALIPDYLALVGDAADGYPGIPGIGAVTAARLLNRHGPIEVFPPTVLADRRELALLFKHLATREPTRRCSRRVDAALDGATGRSRRGPSGWRRRAWPNGQCRPTARSPDAVARWVDAANGSFARIQCRSERGAVGSGPESSGPSLSSQSM